MMCLYICGQEDKGHTQYIYSALNLTMAYIKHLLFSKKKVLNDISMMI